ncbi:hypothetical protein [Ruminococcus sp. NK3A76]|uniref:hypothetical protein n=1 Tax=Ruminococcus sp. NK3A76 TaxID=877411 RepID=UPI00048CBA23|nr:hypothetical protein [Ruminococcus sp. NK3A76]
MDLQKFVDAMYSPTCIVSVEKTPDGGYGSICIAAVNNKYGEMIEKRVKDELGATDWEFVPGLPALAGRCRKPCRRRAIAFFPPLLQLPVRGSFYSCQ